VSRSSELRGRFRGNTAVSDDGKEDPGKKIRFVRRGIASKPKLCPNCLSPLHPADSLSGWLLPEEYTCDKCGYRGHVSLEPADEQDAVEDE
jgi:hypothetical protein